MAGQYLYSSGSLSQDGTLLNEVIINGRQQTSTLPKPTLIEFPLYIGARGLISDIPRLINMGAELLNGAQNLSQMIAAIANGKSIVYSKGGKKNLYDDEISPLSDSDLLAKKKEAIGKKR